MHRKTRLKLTDLNPMLTCTLCTGYLIDATTLTECLHSFCRSCLVRYLHTSQHCPKCDTLVHKTRPLLNASSSQSARSPGNLGVDRVLQNIVYKLVPGLFKDEMKKRRDYYTKNQQAGTSSSTSPRDLEARGEVSEEALVIYSDDENMHVSLEYYIPHRRKVLEEKKDGDNEKKRSNDDSTEEDDIVHKRYLRCPAAVCVKHIKKFIRNKFDLKPNFEIEITHMDNEDDSLPDDYTLMDVAYIYTWRRNGPLPLVFRVFQEANKRQKTKPITKPVPSDVGLTSVDSTGPTTTDPKRLSTNPKPCSKDPTPSKDPARIADSDRVVQSPSSVETKQPPQDAEIRKPISPDLVQTGKEPKSHNGETIHRFDDIKKTTASESLPDFMIVSKEDNQIKSTALKNQKVTDNDEVLASDGFDLEKSKPTLLNNNDKQEIVKDDRPNMNGLSIHLQSDITSLDAPPPNLTAPVSVR